MPELTRGTPPARVRRACASCQRLKKRCDRRAPECSLCHRYGRRCSYAGSDDANAESALWNHRNGDALSVQATSAQASSATGGAFPSVYFLDSLLFQRSLGQITPDHRLDVEAELHDSVGVDRAFVVEYFTHTHPWVPFMSKRRFMERVLSPLGGGYPQPGNMLLIASMKLIANQLLPDEKPAATADYRSVKATLARAESCGLLAFRLLQALIIVALYELGHAIYPAAYLTIGHCVRVGYALGLDRSIEEGSEGLFDATEAEERRRSWWTIILLDRYVNIGSPERRCSIPNPSQTSILPIDDRLWDDASSFYARGPALSYPPNAAMGRFCLTAHATVLLGRVLSNTLDTPDHHEFWQHEALVLDASLVTLARVSLEEGRSRAMMVSSPTTICHSARQLLNDTERSHLRSHGSLDKNHKLNETAMSAASSETLGFAQEVKARGGCPATEMTPFCLEAIYRAAIYYARSYKATRAETDLLALQDAKDILQTTSRRWRAAASYLELLEARSLTGIL